MNLKRPLSPLKIPPREYTKTDFNEIVRQHNEVVQNITNPGDLVASSVRINPITWSGYGLPVGGVYADANNFLKVVVEGEAFAPSFQIRVRLGTVTTSI